MPDNLKIEVAVDVGPVDQLGASAKNLAGTISTLAAQFVASGLSAKDAASALQNLGYSAAQAAAATKNLASAEEMVGAATAATTTKIDNMTRALASSGVRIAASEAGLGQLGFAFARVGAASAVLAPILSVAFPVFALTAFVALVEHASEAFEKWMHLGEETTHKMDDLTLSLSRQNDQLELTNVRVENQIDKLEHKPENFLALALAEDKLRADELSEALENALQKMVQIFEAGQGFGSSLLGKADVASVGKILEPLQTELQLAAKEEDKINVLLREQKILRDAIAEEQAKGTAEPAVGGEGMPFTGMVDQGAINTYKSALAGVQAQLDKMAATDKNRALEAKLAADQRAHEAIANANKIADQEAAANELMMRMAKTDLEEFTKLQRAKLEEAEKEAKEQTRILEVQAKANAAAIKSIDKEAADSYVTSWREAIKSQEADFRKSQQGSELQTRNIAATTSVGTAGLSKGPFTDVLQSKSIEQQTSVAQAAMDQAKNAAMSYNLELAAMAAAQAKVDVSTTEGAKEFQSLQNQIDVLRRQYDSANEATQRWANTLQRLAAEQKALSPNIFQGLATSAQNAAQSGFQAFNSAFIKMAEGGMSFTRLMQTAWTSMATSFITSVLQMGEKWIVQHVLMAAAQKLMDALGLSTHLASISGQIAANKALALSQAGLAGAGGVASMAAAPFPIDLTAPAFGAAMEAAAASFALFERGGIVPAGLHAGEMVLPSHISTFIQTAAAGATGKAGAPGLSGSNRPINFNYHANVSGISNDGIGEMLDAHGDAMFKFFQGKVRRMGVNI